MFTLAHPAAAVPLARWGLAMSALVVGSMAPDFAYCLQLPCGRRFGHSLPGVFLFSLPMGMAVLWVFHAILKRPLLLLLPVSHQQRLIAYAGEFSFVPTSRFAVVVLSLMLGIATHIAWDIFTHSYGWEGAPLRVMNMPVASTMLGPLRLCDALHFGGSFVGVFLICWWYCQWYVQAPECVVDIRPQPATTTKLAVPIVMGAVAFITAAAVAWLLVRGLTGIRLVREFIVRSVFVGMAVLFIEAVIFSVYIRTTAPEIVKEVCYEN